MLRAFLPQLLDLVAPTACGVCGTWLVEPEVALCALCAAELPPAEPEMELGALDGVVAATRYTALVREAMRAFKFGHQPWRGAPLGALVAREAASALPAMDLVLPVPLPADRLRERGYNQSALLARPVGRRLGLPVVHGALERAAGAAPQSERDAAERMLIDTEWRVARPGVVAGRRIVVLDDVITTGATVRSIARLLREHGAVSVWAAALAWTPLPADRSGKRGASGSLGADSPAEVTFGHAIER